MLVGVLYDISRNSHLSISSPELEAAFPHRSSISITSACCSAFLPSKGERPSPPDIGYLDHPAGYPEVLLL